MQPNLRRVFLLLLGMFLLAITNPSIAIVPYTPPLHEQLESFEKSGYSIVIGALKHAGLMDFLEDQMKTGEMSLFLPTDSACERLSPQVRATLFDRRSDMLKYVEQRMLHGQFLISGANDLDPDLIPSDGPLKARLVWWDESKRQFASTFIKDGQRTLLPTFIGQVNTAVKGREVLINDAHVVRGSYRWVLGNAVYGLDGCE